MTGDVAGADARPLFRLRNVQPPTSGAPDDALPARIFALEAAGGLTAAPEVTSAEDLAILPDALFTAARACEERLHDPVRAAKYRELGVETLCTTTVIEGLLDLYVNNGEFPQLPGDMTPAGDATCLLSDQSTPVSPSSHSSSH